jgi:site-specific DNA recombinase
MIEFCKKHKKGNLKIIVYNLDRFSRTGDNAIWLSRQLRDLGILIMSVTQPIDTKNPAGVLQQNILFLFSQYDNDLRRLKAIEGMKERLLCGEWPGHAPIGYDHVTTNGEKTIVINETGKLLRKAFLWKANEGISMVEILSRLKSHGLKLTKQAISKALINPFYCGILSHSFLKGEVIEGKHEKLISKEIFLKANEEKSKSAHGFRWNALNEELPLKLFIKCENCRENLRGYIVKSTNLYYYKCDNGSKCSCNVSAKKLHELFETIQSEITLPEKYIDLFQLQLRKLYTTINLAGEENAKQYKTRLTELEQKIENLEERFIEEKINQELYQKFAHKFSREKAELLEHLQPTIINTSNLERYIELATKRVTEPASMWASSNYAEKQRLQFSIFPEGIYYNKKTHQPRTEKMNSIFAFVADLTGVSQKQETRLSEITLKKSGLADQTRLELATSAVTGRHSNQLNY